MGRYYALLKGERKGCEVRGYRHKTLRAQIFPLYFYYWVLVFFGLLHKDKEMYRLINHCIRFYDKFAFNLCLFEINPWRDDFSTIF